MDMIAVVAICAFVVVAVGASVWTLVEVNLAILEKTSVEDKYPDEKFNLEWFCHNQPIPEKSGRVFGAPIRVVFDVLTGKLQMPVNQIEQMLVGSMAFGTNRNDNYKDVCGREYTVKVEWARYKNLNDDKTKNVLNGMVGMDCRGKY